MFTPPNGNCLSQFKTLKVFKNPLCFDAVSFQLSDLLYLSIAAVCLL